MREVMLSSNLHVYLFDFDHLIYFIMIDENLWLNDIRECKSKNAAADKHDCF